MMSIAASMQARSTKRSDMARVALCLFLPVLCWTSRPACGQSQPNPGGGTQTAPTPSPSPPPAMIPKGKEWSPGKIDFQFRHTSLGDEYNAMFWSPVLKGGAGVINTDGGRATKYGGFFFRPLWRLKDKGDLIIGAQAVETGREQAWEAQAEYRLNFGLGVGGGLVRRTNRNLNVDFFKTSYRNGARGWKYIIEAQAQKIAGRTAGGGYGAVYNNQLMFTAGTDQEQWRTSFAYISPEEKALLRPVVEVLYVDNRVGRVAGPRVYFINGSLRYYGGFLSHPARLGRAMGPTGLEFANPLGFLTPTWNRRLDVWELGDVTNFRLEHITLPNGKTVGRHEFLSFPLQFDKKKGRGDRFFAGAFYTKDQVTESGGILGGFFGKVGHFDLTLKTEYAFSTRTGGVSLGLIRRF